jgi:hypothetical protein
MRHYMLHSTSREQLDQSGRCELFGRPSRIVHCKMLVGQERNTHGITDKQEKLILKQGWIVPLATRPFLQNFKILKFGTSSLRNLITVS